MRRLAPLLLGACVVLATRPAPAQFFSPGPLAKPHAVLEGLDKCGACHDQQRHNAPQLCLSCHAELGPEIQQKTGLHGRMSADTRNRCASCHPDHRGRGFAMIDWGPKGSRGFDHRSASWPLAGKHAAARCETCHDNRRIVVPAVARMLAATPRRTTFLGLQSRCTSCHFDEHRGQVGQDCQRCHGNDAATFASARSFDHARTDFPLRGKHQPLACASCHPTATDPAVPPAFPKPRASTFARYKPIAHGSCGNCHRDPHQGAFGSNCADCHNENGWDVVSPSQQLGDSFHDATRFPLRGLHRDVKCQSCHGPFGSRPVQYKGLAFRKCGDCHPDGHQGQLAPRAGAAAADCADCHGVSGFTPARFELEQHNKTPFPLSGAHRTANCRSCHLVDAQLGKKVDPAVRTKLARQRRPELVALVVMHPKQGPGDCSDCHRDPHQGQFAAQTMAADDCAACHTTDSFAKIRFDHNRDSRFPLTGAHGKAPCAACHRGEVIRPGTTQTIRYKPLATSCASCHLDEHRGQFSRANGRSEQREARGADVSGARAAGNGKDCSFCHGTDSFKKSSFTHQDRRYTTFALAGKHSSLPCGSCHRPVQIAGQIQTVRYRPVPRDCEGCHADFHHGGFRGFEP